MPSPPRSRVIALIAALIVVMIMVVVADRVAPVIIGREIGATLQRALHTPERPQVQIGGFPFLTQVAAAEYESVQVRADQVPVPGTGGELTLRRVQARMTEVETTDERRRLLIGRLAISAEIDYRALSELLGRPVRPAGGGRIAIEMPLSVIVAGRPTIDADGRFLLADAEFTLHDRVLPDRIAERMPELPRPPVPDIGGVEFTEVTATRNGLILAGRGEDLELTR